MKEFLRIVWAVLLYLWQLPQNLIGLVYLAFCFDRVKITKQGGAVFYATKHVRGGMTMGRYVFISPKNIAREPVYDHEFGHVRQSKRWGWLWLPVFAIPSGLHCLFCRAANYPFLYREVGKSARRNTQLQRGIPLPHGRTDSHVLGQTNCSQKQIFRITANLNRLRPQKEKRTVLTALFSTYKIPL